MSSASILIVFVATLFPATAFAAPRTWSELAYGLVTLMNGGVAVLVALAIALYFYGISSNILTLGESDPKIKKAYFFWGIIILFVMVSVWGILRLLQTTLFG